MAWITIAESDVLTEFTPDEAATFAAVQGAVDELANILPRIINEFRGAIAAGGYEIDPNSATTLPPDIAEQVIARARWKWLASFPDLKSLQTDARKEANDEARDVLKLLRQQEFPVEPITPAVNPRSGQWQSQAKLVPRTFPLPDPAQQVQPGGSGSTGVANPDGPMDT